MKKIAGLFVLLAAFSCVLYCEDFDSFIKDKTYLPVEYLDALKGEDRNILLKYNPQIENNSEYDFAFERDTEWYENGTFRYMEFSMRMDLLYFGNSFFIKICESRKETFGYNIKGKQTSHSKEKNVLDGKVKCNVPDSPYILNYDYRFADERDRSKIEAWLGAESDEEERFSYRNPGQYSEELEEIIWNDGNKIVKEHIYELLRSEKKYSKFFFIRPNLEFLYIKPSIKPFYYNGQIIGQKAMTADNDSFSYLDISFYIIFVIDGAIVSTGVSYDNPYDKSIIEAYPQLFKPVSNGKYKWKNEAAREEFYKIFESDDEDKPQIMKEMKAALDMILETLVINDSVRSKR